MENTEPKKEDALTIQMDYEKHFNHTYHHRTDELEPCICGFKPPWYSVYYGRTPYDIHCPTCKKQTIFYLEFSGWHKDVIQFWNEVVSKTSDPAEIKQAILSSPHWSQFGRRFKPEFKP